MTKRQFLLAAVIVLALIGSVSAISLFTEEPPAGMPADANVTIAENIQERQDLPVHMTQLSVERIAPANATPAAVVAINLKVTNRGNERVNAMLDEDQRPGCVYTDPYPVFYHNYEAMKIPFYRWNLTLEPGSTRTITYHIQPEGVGTIAFTSARLVDEYGNQVESGMTSIRVACIPNGVCDAGENTIYCPEDCPKGGSDGFCDGSPDGKIDPDCIQGYDPDTAETPAPIPTKKGFLPGPSAAMTVAVLAGVFFVARCCRKK